MTSHGERLHFDKREKKSTRQALNHQTHQWRARDSSTEGEKKRRAGVKPFKAFYFSSGCLRDKTK